MFRMQGMFDTMCVFFMLSSRREFRLTLIDKRIKLRQKCEFIFSFLKISIQYSTFKIFDGYFF